MGAAIVLFVRVCVASVPTRVVVASGSVIVRSVLVPGLVTVNIPVPEALAVNAILDIVYPYIIAHLDPEGIVTVIPALIVIGPDDRAFLPEVIV